MYNECPASDCQEAYEQGERDDTKLYNIKPNQQNTAIYKVKCLFDSNSGWTVMMDRGNGSVDFSRSIDGGLGHIDGEFWAGMNVMLDIRVGDKYRTIA